MKIGKYGGGNMAQAESDHVPFLSDNRAPHPDLLAAMPAKRRSLFRPVCCQDNLVVEG